MRQGAAAASLLASEAAETNDVARIAMQHDRDARRDAEASGTCVMLTILFKSAVFGCGLKVDGEYVLRYIEGYAG